MRRRRSTPAVLAFLLSACGGSGGGGDDGGGGGGGTPTPPAQPATGPGGSAAAFTTVVSGLFGSGDTAYWIFEPAGTGTAPLPLVVFLHGYGALDPETYGRWIDHLVLRGAIVVFPQYQQDLTTSPFTYTSNAVAAVKDALVRLAAGGHAVPDLARTAVAGHSYGGVLAANLAAVAAANALPAFKAVLCAAPGTGGFPTYADYADVPAGTLLLSVACEDDTVIGSTDAKRIFDETTAVPLADKDFVLVHSDPHGSPPLVAQHGAPTSLHAVPADALDYFGFWKWLDALMDAAFTGTNRDVALGDTPAQRFMGLWSDGVPVVEPTVTDAP